MRVEISGDRIMTVVEGMWNDQQLAMAGETFRTAVQRFARAAKPFDILSDLSAFSVQQKQVAEGMGALIDYANAHGLRRSANVVSSALLRLQMQRLFGTNPRFRVFDDRALAVAWLDEPA